MDASPSIIEGIQHFGLVNMFFNSLVLALYKYGQTENFLLIGKYFLNVLRIFLLNPTSSIMS